MTVEPDLIIRLRNGLEQIVEFKAMPDHVRITTHCMYPSNGLVTVCVFSGRESAVVTDGGGALSECLSAGIASRPSDKTLEQLVRAQGLKLVNGVISSPHVSLDEAAVAILLVANASKEVSQWLYDHAKLKRSRDFRKVLSEFLQVKFERKLVHDVLVMGKRKQHRFSNVIQFPSGKRLLIDPVAHEASSINARVIANLDVQQAENPEITQRIVYDDEEDWSPADLSLLGIGAPAIAFSQSAQVIERIAERAA